MITLTTVISMSTHVTVIMIGSSECSDRVVGSTEAANTSDLDWVMTKRSRCSEFFSDRKPRRLPSQGTQLV